MNFRRFGQSLVRSDDLATACLTSTGSFHFATDNELRFHKQATLANSTTIEQMNRKFEKEWKWDVVKWDSSDLAKVKENAAKSA